MIVGILEVFQSNRDELLRMAWGGGVFIDVGNNEVQISHGLSKSVKFRLKHVELINGGESFIKVGDLRELIS